MKSKPGKRGRPRPSAEGGAQEEGLVWGINAVREILLNAPRSVHEVLVQRGKAGPKYQEIIDLARAGRVRLRFVEANRLGVPPRARHQGVAARQAGTALFPLEELLGARGVDEPGMPQRLLVLDSIQDPQNLGAILRSALAAGFGSVITTRERSAPLSGTVMKTSAGAAGRLRICQVVNLAETLKILKTKGYWIYGAVADRDAPVLYETEFAPPVCLVVGSEGRGIRPLVRKQCDHLITIPLPEGLDSLNVSVAAAVIMFEVVRRHLQPK